LTIKLYCKINRLVLCGIGIRHAWVVLGPLPVNFEGSYAVMLLESFKTLYPSEGLSGPFEL